ncbi:hypothetical protein [Rhodoflexus sp.]
MYDARKLTLNFQEKVVVSTLTREEKIKLLSVSTSILALIEFLEEGGYERIAHIVSQVKYGADIPTARVEGCSVNWGDVAASAVAGGLIGGYLGAKTGCTGGMVAGPIGAASGCVGGAVMGFASGFTYSAIGGIAASLYRTCF